MWKPSTSSSRIFNAFNDRIALVSLWTTMTRETNRSECLSGKKDVQLHRTALIETRFLVLGSRQKISKPEETSLDNATLATRSNHANNTIRGAMPSPH